jgi:hypothetical protein
MHINNSRKKFVTAVFAAVAGAVALTGCQSPFTSAEPDYEALESYISDEVNGDFSSQISREVSGVDCPRQADTVTSGESFVCIVDVDGHDVRVEVTAKNQGSTSPLSTSSTTSDPPRRTWRLKFRTRSSFP